MTHKTSDDFRPWDAFIAPTERIDLTEATGRIAASTIRQYPPGIPEIIPGAKYSAQTINTLENAHKANVNICLLYTSPSPRDKRQSRMPSSA